MKAFMSHLGMDPCQRIVNEEEMGVRTEVPCGVLSQDPDQVCQCDVTAMPKVSTTR